MKVLHIITGLNRGGAQSALFNILRGGLHKSAENRVVSLMDDGVVGPQMEAVGIPVHALRMRRGIPSPGGLRKLRSILSDFRPDAIHGWMYHGNLAASVGRRLSGAAVPVAWNIRQTLYELAKEKALTRLVIRAGRIYAKDANRIVYNSVVSRDQHEAFGFASDASCVIPNGFDLEQLRPNRGAKAALADKLGLSESELLVGHVARFHPMKDHALCLRAGVRIVKKRPDVRFLFLGCNVDNDNLALSRVVPEALRDRFMFLGERTDIGKIMPALDVLCLSSAWGEGFPNVLGEAMACGVPCVTTDVGDCARIVGQTGVVVPALDDAALTNGLERILSLTAQEREVLGKECRRRIRESYAIETVVSQYLDLYQDMTSEPC